MKINKRDFLNIIKLLEDGTITEGKFVNKEIVTQLKLNGSVKEGKRTPKVRYIDLVKSSNVFMFLKNYHYNIASIEDIQKYMDEIFDTDISRDIVQKWRNNTKEKNSKSLKGLYVSSLEKIDIKIDEKRVSLIPNNGVGYFLFYTQKIELYADTIVVGVENYQVAWFAQKYGQLFDAKKMLFVVINPFMLEWIENVENEYVHFGDYDLAGINIYLNKIIPRLKKSQKYSFFIPENIDYLIHNYGNSSLYEQQKQKYKNLETKDEKIKELMELIRNEKKSIEQEGILEY